MLPTAIQGLEIVPADRNLTGAEIEMVGLLAREQRLRRLLRPIAERYHYVFIDCPPSLGLLTLNALVAADSVLIPLHCEYFALEGLAELVSTLRRVRAALNPGLDIEGVLLTMYDERTNLGQQVARDVRGFFKEKTFNTVIPRNVRLGEAPSHGMPVALYDVKSRGAEAYLALAREFLERDAARAAQEGGTGRRGEARPTVGYWHFAIAESRLDRRHSPVPSYSRNAVRWSWPSSLGVLRVSSEIEQGFRF